MAARLNYAIEQRLRFIDFCLSHYGHFNRLTLIEFFGISLPQATLDIKAYLKLAPANAMYDKTARSYLRAAKFKHVY